MFFLGVRDPIERPLHDTHSGRTSSPCCCLHIVTNFGATTPCPRHLPQRPLALTPRPTVQYRREIVAIKSDIHKLNIVGRKRKTMAVIVISPFPCQTRRPFIFRIRHPPSSFFLLELPFSRADKTSSVLSQWSRHPSSGTRKGKRKRAMVYMFIGVCGSYLFFLLVPTGIGNLA